MPAPTIDLALSVQQPWASALIAPVGRKLLENRYNRQAIDRPPFPVAAGSWLGIHAGKTVHHLAGRCVEMCPAVAGIEWPLGALIGAVRIVGWMRASEALQDARLRPWVLTPDDAQLAATQALADADADRERRPRRRVAPEAWCLVTDDAARLTHPIPMRGALGLMRLASPVSIR